MLSVRTVYVLSSLHLGGRLKGDKYYNSCRQASHRLPRAAPPKDLRQENTEWRSGIFRTSPGRRPSILAEHAPKKACGLFRRSTSQIISSCGTTTRRLEGSVACCPRRPLKIC